MKLWSGYYGAPFADSNRNGHNNNSRSKAVCLAGKMSSHVNALTSKRRAFFAVLLLVVVGITTKAMQAASTTDVPNAHTTAETRATAAVAEPFVFGMEEPWGDGSWGYPKAEERSIKTSLKSSPGPSGPLSAAAALAAVKKNPNKEKDQIVESSTVSKFWEGLRPTLSKFFTGGGQRLRHRGRITW